MQESYYQQIKEKSLEELLLIAQQPGLFLADNIQHVQMASKVARYHELDEKIKNAKETGNREMLRELGMHLLNLDYSRNHQSLKTPFFRGIDALKYIGAVDELIEAGKRALNQKSYVFAYEAFVEAESKENIEELANLMQIRNVGNYAYNTIGQVRRYCLLHSGKLKELEKIDPLMVKELVYSHERSMALKGNDKSLMKQYGEWDLDRGDVQSAREMFAKADIPNVDYKIGNYLLRKMRAEIQELKKSALRFNQLDALRFNQLDSAEYYSRHMSIIKMNDLYHKLKERKSEIESVFSDLQLKELERLTLNEDLLQQEGVLQKFIN